MRALRGAARALGCGTFLWAGMSVADLPSANPSSHAAAFFSELLTNRVWVARPAAVMAPGTGNAWAAYFGADGGLVSCAVGGASEGMGWRVSRSRAHRAVLERMAGDGDAGERPPRRDTMFYEGETGWLHMEMRVEADGGLVWFPASFGWVQESWPRSMVERCPDLALPAELPVNERQTSGVYEEMERQDPDAVVRRFPGWELRGPGASGRGRAFVEGDESYGAGTLSGEELRDFLLRRDGEVLVHNDGSRHVLVLRAAGDELWRLGADGSVADVGYLTLAGDEIVLQYEQSDREERWAADFALPLLPTGERYAAMRFGDWLVSRRDPVVLPFHGAARVGFRFGSGGTAAASTVDGGAVDAAWHWSRGSLVLRVRGFDRAASYPWARLAAHVGWPEAAR